MRIKGIDFDEHLFAAQQNRALVIFAGAGVSNSEPSNLPLFNELTQLIEEWAHQTRKNNESNERFLGRLTDQEVKVHERAAQILSNPESQPTQLHRDLLRLFNSLDQVRLVTTNFDPHFETAAKEVFGCLPDVYQAPALPLGNDFLGIVYLHGSVRSDPKRLVLTDKDFGRAYLTEGWATRFLRAMFARYTVLFVGYSHNDTVMDYLARGLPPEGTQSRFALVKKDTDLTLWEHRGIKPLTYPGIDDDHSKLVEAIEAWAEWVNRGALETEQRIKELVNGPPPLGKEEEDFLLWALSNDVAVRFFVRHAKSPEWLVWTSERDVLKPLFSRVELPSLARELANWIAENFVVDHADDLFAIMESYNQRLNPYFWSAITFQLACRGPVPDQNTLLRWTPIMLQNMQPCDATVLLELLKRCLEVEADSAVIQWFELLTTPRLKLRESFVGNGQTSAELAFPCDFLLLEEVWNKAISPQLVRLALRLWPVVIRNINRCYDLLQSWGKASLRGDSISWQRSAIEPHEQDQYPRPVDVLINAARDILEWGLKYAPSIGQAWIESLSASEPLILRRLAIHGVRLSIRLTADEKVQLMLGKAWLLVPGLKHEVFQLLKEAYPGVDPDVHEQFLEEAIRQIDSQPIEDEEDKKHREYKKFNLLHWLSLAVPACPEVTARLARIKKLYPQFKPREYPDLDFWGGGGYVAHRTPVSVEEILAKRPEELIDYVENFQEDELGGYDLSGLLQTVGEAVQQDYNWSMGLAQALKGRNNCTSNLWNSVIQGWSQANLSLEQWKHVLTTVNDGELAQQYANVIADLLLDGVRKKTAGILVALLAEADNVATTIWRHHGAEPPLETEDWLKSAINHPGGKLAEFWLLSMSRFCRQTDACKERIPNPYRQRFEEILRGETDAAVLGRVVLVSQLGYLFSIDEKWTRSKVLPLLDWDKDAQQARQAWDGWLNWGRWSAQLLPELIPHYKEAFSHLSSAPEEKRLRLVSHVANIAVYGLNNPLEEYDWISAFLRAGAEEDRVAFATWIHALLMNVQAEVKKHLWERWLKKYWQGRNQGIPIPFSDRELGKTVEWISELEPVFPEAVAVICEGEVPHLEDVQLFYRLKESELPGKYPEALARLLIHLISDHGILRRQCSGLESLTERLIVAKAPANLLHKLCEQLARAGCRNAESLDGKIDVRDVTEDPK
ncbi:MAG: DUF4020 domain-containing protein [Deltaproteobacteria bacterium]|nr:DUF4020 domain-containing protein [Deltaproteobacteria bacterium]